MRLISVAPCVFFSIASKGESNMQMNNVKAAEVLAGGSLAKFFDHDFVSDECADKIIWR